MSYMPKIYREHGGDKMVFAAGSTTLLKPVITKGVNYSVLAADSGAIFYTTAADLVFSLPSTAAGLIYTFINGVDGVAAGLSVSPVTVDKITGRGIATPLDNKDIVNTGATDAIGDMVTLIGDGVDGWYVINQNGTWTREA